MNHPWKDVATKRIRTQLIKGAQVCDFDRSDFQVSMGGDLKRIFKSKYLGVHLGPGNSLRVCSLLSLIIRRIFTYSSKYKCVWLKKWTQCLSLITQTTFFLLSQPVLRIQERIQSSQKGQAAGQKWCPLQGWGQHVLPLGASQVTFLEISHQ